MIIYNLPLKITLTIWQQTQKISAYIDSYVQHCGYHSVAHM